MIDDDKSQHYMNIESKPVEIDKNANLLRTDRGIEDSGGQHYLKNLTLFFKIVTFWNLNLDLIMLADFETILAIHA